MHIARVKLLGLLEEGEPGMGVYNILHQRHQVLRQQILA